MSGAAGNFRTKIVQIGFFAVADFFQRLPKAGFQADTGAMARDRDIP